MKTPSGYVFKSVLRLLVLLIALGSITGFIAHWWISDRLGVLRALYPTEAVIYRSSIQCDEGAPAWMKLELYDAVTLNWAPKNQLVYISPEGTAYRCVNGWVGVPFLSDRVDHHHRFRGASMTKVVTAGVALRLAVNDGLHLQDNLVNYIADLDVPFDARVWDITLAQLLEHRGGFDRVLSPDSVSQIHIKPWCPYNLRYLSSQRLDFTPGERYSYSNLGYCLIGQVIAKVSEQSYEQAVESVYQIEERGLAFVVNGYLDDEIRYDFRNSDFHGESYHQLMDLYALGSAAGLSGSATAFAELFYDMANDEQINLLAEPTNSLCDTSALWSCYGFSLMHYKADDNPLKIYVQDGILPGLESAVLFDDQGGVTVFTSAGWSPSAASRSGRLERIYNRLSRFYFDS